MTITGETRTVKPEQGRLTIMANKRKYICSCGKEYTTSEGLNKHLRTKGCPRDQIKVMLIIGALTFASVA